MKFATVALILASATGLAAGADDLWHNRKLNERQAVGANPHATEVRRQGCAFSDEWTR